MSIDKQHAGLDETLVAILADQLGCDVRLIPLGMKACGEEADAVRAALARPGKAAVTSGNSGASRVTLALPAGGVAQWHADPAHARASAAHGETVIAWQTTLNERNQLQAEADSLAAQVVQDFEELSLIRSLALSLELPDGGLGPGELAMKSLRPLADGVGAVSIAAVFFSDDGQQLRPACWSGPSLANCDTLHQLIAEHRGEAEQRPVVRNQVSLPHPIQAGDRLKEFVLVQCRSQGRLHGWLIACNRAADASQEVPWAQLGFSTVQATLLETATNQLASQLHNLRLLRQKEELFTDVVRALVNAVEARDPYTCGHSERVARFAKCLASVIGETAVECERLYLTGLLHDVGKIAVPDGVLRKPGQLDQQERAIIETHAEAGWRILHELDALRDVLPGVLYHHERYDGSGYPDGLTGEGIPLDGRILAVCDAFDAMTSDRPYRQGMPIGQSLEVLRGGAGKQWDPNLVQAFIENIAAIDEIRLGHRPRQQAARRSALVGGTLPSS